MEELVDAGQHGCRTKLGRDVDSNEPAMVADSMGCIAVRDRRIRDLSCELSMGSVAQRAGAMCGAGNTLLLFRISTSRMAY